MIPPGIEAKIIALVQSAPVRDPALVAALVGELRANASPLARSIARVVELVDAGQIDQAIALPALAMACSTLCDPRLTEREHEAARFEIETLLPLPPGSKPAPALTAPDVPLIALRKRADSD